MLHLYDTARRAVVPLELREPGKVGMYVCGPTVYGPPHLGHGRAVIVWDVLRRYLAWSGLEVHHVSNITDIDDKIIERANDEGRDSSEIARKCESIWWEAMDRIDVLRPHDTPHATDYVEGMVGLIGRLVDAGAAYVAPDGVYLRVATVDGYGLLAGQSLDQLVEGGGDRELVGTDKEHAADFALWKFSKPDEPAWPSPWGDGRPGWHTECVVMSLDLHRGGLDLTFPNQLKVRAQAVADGREFARHWAHNGFVEQDGTKMSKSLGNVRNLLDLTEQYDPRAYRLLILQSHYRSPMDVTADNLRSAEAALDRLDTFARRTAALGGSVDAEVVAAFGAAVDDDLDTPAGMDLLFRQVREGNAALDRGDDAAAAAAGATVRRLAEAFGLRLVESADVPADIVAMAQERAEARAAKDFARADELRDALTAAGWVVEDGSDGPVVRPA